MKKALLLNILLLFTLFSCEEFKFEDEADTFFHVKITGTELPVWVKGNTNSRKFIVFINGGPGLTSIDIARADMFGWSEGFEDEFAMVYYDQRGCGNAQGNFDTNTLTIEQYVKDLDAIISVINAKYDNPKIFLMGHSFGGFIGANFLLTDNLHDKISGWISVDAAYNFDFDITWQYRRQFLIDISEEEIQNNRNVDYWTEANQWAQENPRIETKTQKNKWSGFIGNPGGIILPDEVASLSVRQYLQIGFASSYNPFPAYVSGNLNIVNDALNEDAEGINLISSVSKITVPTVFIWGKYDDLIPVLEGQAVFENLGTDDNEKSFIIMPKSGHEPNLSDPISFKNHVIDFVRNN